MSERDMRNHFKRKRIVISTPNSIPARPVKKTYTLFTCINNRTGEEWQGIKYSDGKCRAGYDCWRSLSKADFCDYPFKNYANEESLMNDVSSIKPYIKKSYYLA